MRLMGVIALLLVVLLAPRARGDTLREDEFLCEDAVAHIHECCPDFDVTSVACNYTEGGCGTKTVNPDLSEFNSACLIDASCADIVKGTCGESPCH